MSSNNTLFSFIKGLTFALSCLIVCTATWGYEVVKDESTGDYSVHVDIVKMHHIFVAVNGDDYNPGTISKPFATLERARNEIRQLKENHKFPGHGVVVQIRGGTYSLDETFKLDKSDSGTQSAPIIYRNYGNEKVRLIGGVKLKQFNKVKQAGVLSRLSRDAVQHVLEADLAASGITDPGEIGPVGYSLPDKPTPMELFLKGERMQLARWPNEGWATTLEAREFGRIPIPKERLQRWAFSRDIWIHGYLNQEWADYLLRVASVDQQKGDMQTESTVDIASGRRYYVLNVIEELDKPGEWYLDREKGKIFFWPSSDISTAEVYLSKIDTMVEVNNATDILFRGLAFEICRASAVVIKDCSKVLIQDCTIKTSGNYGVKIRRGTECGVLDCEILDTGYGGIVLDGGDRNTLTPGSNFAFNNHIHHYSRWVRTYRPAINISGVGNHASHNLIHDAPHDAILFSGNDHVIEFNEIYDVCQETFDCGAIYAFQQDWSMRGTVIRFNFIHNLKSSSFEKGVMGVYLDEAASGMTVYGNIFYKAGGAVVIGGGRDNIIKNNIFIESDPVVHIDSRGFGRARVDMSLGGGWRLHEKLVRVNFDKPPYSERYPSLAKIWLNDPLSPIGNTISCNIFWGGVPFEMDEVAKKNVIIKDNIFKDPVFTWSTEGGIQISEAIFKDQDCLMRIPYEDIGRVRK